MATRLSALQANIGTILMCPERDQLTHLHFWDASKTQDAHRKPKEPSSGRVHSHAGSSQNPLFSACCMYLLLCDITPKTKTIIYCLETLTGSMSQGFRCGIACLDGRTQRLGLQSSEGSFSHASGCRNGVHNVQAPVHSEKSLRTDQGGDGVLCRSVVMVAGFCEYAKNHWNVHFSFSFILFYFF